MATILLVEDQPATREAIRAFLEQDGHTVLEAGTGLEALAVAGVAAPDLISACRTPTASTSPSGSGRRPGWLASRSSP